MSRYHPWRHLRDAHPCVTVTTHRQLPDGVRGRWTADGNIEICASLLQDERRCTVTHETIHLERGPVPRDEEGREREEAIVRELAARRLITMEELVDAVLWAHDGHPDFEDLWVDEPTRDCRLHTLQPWEIAYINTRLEGRAA